MSRLVLIALVVLAVAASMADAKGKSKASSGGSGGGSSSKAGKKECKKAQKKLEHIKLDSSLGSPNATLTPNQNATLQCSCKSGSELFFTPSSSGSSSSNVTAANLGKVQCKDMTQFCAQSGQKQIKGNSALTGGYVSLQAVCNKNGKKCKVYAVPVCNSTSGAVGTTKQLKSGKKDHPCVTSPSAATIPGKGQDKYPHVSKVSCSGCDGLKGIKGCSTSTNSTSTSG